MSYILYPGRLSLIVCLSLASVPPFALADDSAITETPDQPIQLESLTVSGNWLGTPSPETLKTYPGARSLITEQDLHESGVRNLEDALRLVPGVRVQDESGTGALPNIGVRGLNPARSERAMVLVDGIPVALAPYTGTGLSLFPVTMQSIQAVDIARGGVAVHYGPNNVGGVINMITKPISRDFTATLKESLTIATENGHLLSDTYLRAGGFLNDSFGLQFHANTLQGEAWREHSDTDISNLMLDADWYMTDNTSLKGRLQYYQADVELPGALSPSQFSKDQAQSKRPEDNFKADTWRGSLALTHHFDNAEFNWTNFAHTSRRKFAFGQPFDPSVSLTDVSTSPRDFFVAGSEPRLSFAVPMFGVNHQITVGGRYVREEVDFIVDRQNLASGATARLRNWRFDTDAYAGYISDTISLFDDRLKITPGLRYENVFTRFDNRLAGAGSSNRAEELLPGFDVGYQLNDWLFVFGNTHRSLRPPQVAQVTREGDVGAEVAMNYEAGVRLTSSSAFDVTLTAFRIDFDNQIEFDRASLKFKNLGETRHQGLELDTGWRPDLVPGLDLRASYTLLDAEQMKGQFKHNDVPFASEHQITLAGNYQWHGYHFNINGHYQGDAYSDAANTNSEDSTGTAGKIPAYWLWDMAVSKDFKTINDSTTKVSLGLNNIFDREYYFRGVDVSPVGRVPGPGRSVMLSVQLDI